MVARETVAGSVGGVKNRQPEVELQTRGGLWEPALGGGIVSRPLCPPEGRLRRNTQGHTGRQAACTLTSSPPGLCTVPPSGGAWRTLQEAGMVDPEHRTQKRQGSPWRHESDGTAWPPWLGHSQCISQLPVPRCNVQLGCTAGTGRKFKGFCHRHHTPV